MGQERSCGVANPARLAAVRQSGLLDSSREEIFDRLLEVAAAVLMTPVALVSVVDDSQEVVKSSIGLPEPLAARGTIPLAESFSAFVVDRGEPILIQNARQDPVLREHPAAQQSVVAYIGVPLCTREGHVLGAISALDSNPRVWSEQHVRILRALAGAIMAEVERRLELRERETLEEQFRHAQKMEAVGRLAGGIAHDFNNLLTAISGFAQLVRQDTEESDPRIESIDEILSAAERAATLTGQILAFSRQQVLRPRLLDPNGVVRGVEKMLGRVLGADVELITSLEPALGRVLADPGQIEQVLMNLAVNARDAMPDGGTLRIETSNAELGEEHTRRYYYVEPGDYVRLRISDTGSGMDVATLERVFDPFFTTKDPGKGTGLGLSTVYGIVKQSGGYIWVESEPGAGTAFDIYLPIATAETEREEPPAAAPPAAGEATVLLVEGEDSIRRIMRMVLRRAGFHTLEAPDGDEAVAVAAAYDEPIHALVTDLIAPGIRGQEVARRITAQRPGVRVLYVASAADPEPDSPGSELLLQKPFTPTALLGRVRELLQAVPGGPG